MSIYICTRNPSQIFLDSPGLPFKLYATFHLVGMMLVSYDAKTDVGLKEIHVKNIP